jgi:hypothetical protein
MMYKKNRHMFIIVFYFILVEVVIYWKLNSHNVEISILLEI